MAVLGTILTETVASLNIALVLSQWVDWSIQESCYRVGKQEGLMISGVFYHYIFPFHTFFMNISSKFLIIETQVFWVV